MIWNILIRIETSTKFSLLKKKVLSDFSRHKFSFPPRNILMQFLRFHSVSALQNWALHEKLWATKKIKIQKLSFGNSTRRQKIDAREVWCWKKPLEIWWKLLKLQQRQRKKIRWNFLDLNFILNNFLFCHSEKNVQRILRWMVNYESNALTIWNKIRQRIEK